MEYLLLAVYCFFIGIFAVGIYDNIHLKIKQRKMAKEKLRKFLQNEQNRQRFESLMNEIKNIEERMNDL